MKEAAEAAIKLLKTFSDKERSNSKRLRAMLLDLDEGKLIAGTADRNLVVKIDPFPVRDEREEEGSSDKLYLPAKKVYEAFRHNWKHYKKEEVCIVVGDEGAEVCGERMKMAYWDPLIPDVPGKGDTMMSFDGDTMKELKRLRSFILPEGTDIQNKEMYKCLHWTPGRMTATDGVWAYRYHYEDHSSEHEDLIHHSDLDVMLKAPKGTLKGMRDENGMRMRRFFWKKSGMKFAFMFSSRLNDPKFRDDDDHVRSLDPPTRGPKAAFKAQRKQLMERIEKVRASAGSNLQNIEKKSDYFLRAGKRRSTVGVLAADEDSGTLVIGAERQKRPQECIQTVPVKAKKRFKVKVNLARFYRILEMFDDELIKVWYLGQGERRPYPLLIGNDKEAMLMVMDFQVGKELIDKIDETRAQESLPF